MLRYTTLYVCCLAITSYSTNTQPSHSTDTVNETPLSTDGESHHEDEDDELILDSSTKLTLHEEQKKLLREMVRSSYPSVSPDLRHEAQYVTISIKDPGLETSNREAFNERNDLAAMKVNSGLYYRRCGKTRFGKTDSTDPDCLDTEVINDRSDYMEQWPTVIPNAHVPKYPPRIHTYAHLFSSRGANRSREWLMNMVNARPERPRNPPQRPEHQWLQGFEDKWFFTEVMEWFQEHRQ